MALATELEPGGSGKIAVIRTVGDMAVQALAVFERGVNGGVLELRPYFGVAVQAEIVHAPRDELVVRHTVGVVTETAILPGGIVARGLDQLPADLIVTLETECSGRLSQENLLRGAVGPVTAQALSIGDRRVDAGRRDLRFVVTVDAETDGILGEKAERSGTVGRNVTDLAVGIEDGRVGGDGQELLVGRRVRGVALPARGSFDRESAVSRCE
jgi:hypothetical protein